MGSNGSGTGSSGAPRSAPSSARAMQILELLATGPRRAYTLADLKRVLGFSQGNLHAILSNLATAGYVRRDAADRTYSVGPALLPLGLAARSAYPEVDVAIPFLEALSAEFDTECNAGMRIGNEILIVARTGPLQPIGLGVTIGQRLPFVPPMHLVFVAWSTREEVDAYLATASGVLSEEERAGLRRILSSIRARGYSVVVNSVPRQRMSEFAATLGNEDADGPGAEELVTLVHELGHHRYVLEDLDDPADDILRVVAPVYDDQGRVALSVSVAYPPFALVSMSPRACGERLLVTARAITRAIGGRQPVRA